MKKTISIVLAISSILLSSTMLFVSADEGAYDNLGATNNYTSNYDSSDESSYNGIDSSDIENKEEYILGDLDGNKKVDATDYLRIKKGFLGEHSIKGTEFAMADVDFDGEITASDYLRLKNVFLYNETLDDSAWEKQEEKNGYETNDDFAIQFQNGKYEESLLKIETVSNANLACNVLYYVDEYEDVGFPKERIITNHKGENVTIKYYYTDWGETGYKTYVYTDDDWNYWFLNASGEVVGIHLNTGTFESTGHDKIKTMDEAIALGLEKAKKLWNDMQFVCVDASSGIDWYRLSYNRVINGIKTTENVNIWLNPNGDLEGWYYYSTGMDNYDLRTFNPDDNIELYSSKIAQIGKNLILDDDFIKNYWGLSKDQMGELKITIREPSFGIGADGKLAGYTWVNFKDEKTGFSTTQYVGFYAVNKSEKAAK